MVNILHLPRNVILGKWREWESHKILAEARKKILDRKRRQEKSEVLKKQPFQSYHTCAWSVSKLEDHSLCTTHHSIMIVRIQTKSFEDSIQLLSAFKGPTTKNVLHVDVSGKNSSIQSTDNLKVVMIDATTASKQTNALIEDCYSWDGCVFLKVCNFPDNLCSAKYTTDIVSIIYKVFNSINNCSDIIINCHHGRNRCIMLTCRVASLIQHGRNEPSREAYRFYQQLCKSIYSDYDPGDMRTWPSLCCNIFVQNEVFLFPRREGLKYPSFSSGVGVHVDNPHGSIFVQKRR